MLYAGLDLSRKRLDVHLLDQAGATVEVKAARPDADGLRTLALRLGRFGVPIRAAIESMNGARFVHDQLERQGWEVEIAPCPVSDLFGASGRKLLARLQLPEPWAGSVEASLYLIDELEREIDACERELQRLGAEHRYVPLLRSVPGIAWVLAYTIAAEIGDSARFPTPAKLVGYSGLCPRVYQSGDSDRRGPLAKQGPKYLRWALVEARQAGPQVPALGAGRGRDWRLPPPRLSGALRAHEGPARQAARRQGRPGRPRPPARRGDLAHAEPQSTLRSGRRHVPPGRLTVPKEMRYRSEPPITPDPPARRR